MAMIAQTIWAISLVFNAKAPRVKNKQPRPVGGYRWETMQDELGVHGGWGVGCKGGRALTSPRVDEEDVPSQEWQEKECYKYDNDAPSTVKGKVGKQSEGGGEAG